MKHFDVQAALGFIQSQTSHIEQTVNETVYPEIQYPGLIPVDTSAHPMAQTVTYYSSDRFGQAGWVNANADGIPLVDSEMAEHNTSVYTAAVGYGWAWQEIEQAQMLGVNLSADRASTARRAYEEMVDRVALAGDADKSFVGLFNSPVVTAASPTTGDWATATPKQILADVNDALQLVHTATATTIMANTLLLPWNRFNQVATTPYGPEGTNFLYDLIRDKNIYTVNTGQPLVIRALRGLDAAGAGGVSRMIAYRRDPEVLKMHIPMPHRFMPVYQDGPLRWVVPGVFRLGGLDIRRPKEMIYVDGI